MKDSQRKKRKKRNTNKMELSHTCSNMLLEKIILNLKLLNNKTPKNISSTF